MATNRTKNARPSEKALAGRQKPRSLAIATKGIVTGRDFAAFMSALMSDLIDGRVAPNIGNATCNAGAKLLKVVEMSMKYGTASATDGPKMLVLAPQAFTEEAKQQIS